MNDIFKDMQIKVGCAYISDLPYYKREVWQEMKRLNPADYEERQLEDFSVYVFGMSYQILQAVMNGAADVFLETERKDFRMFSLEERERAVELYFTTPMTTAQVVEHLGYPTRQCLERWLAMDPRYAGHMAKPIIPLETRRRAVELVLGGMQQKQAAKQLGVSVGAVHGWVRAYRKGGMAALQPKNRNSAQGNKPADSRRRPSAADDDDAEALRRRVEELELENALMREVVEVVKKKTPAPTCGACRTGRRPC